MNAIRAVKLILLAILLVVISVSINFIKCTDNRLFTLLKNWTQSALPSLESNSVLLNIAGRSNQSSSDKNGDFNTIFDFNITTSIFEQCRTCALVSSSGYLRNSSAGARINVADCIFRMNMAPVRGYENDVGNRTTFRFVAHSSLHFIFHSLYRKHKEQDILEQNDGLRYLITFGPEENVCFDCWRIQGLRSWLRKYPTLLAYRLSTDAEKRYHEEFLKDMALARESKVWMTTGFYALNFMRNFCRVVTVFGIARPEDDPCMTNVAYHYWERPNYSECDEFRLNEKVRMNRTGTGHSFKAERQMLEQWKVKYDIQFVHPTW